MGLSLPPGNADVSPFGSGNCSGYSSLFFYQIDEASTNSCAESDLSREGDVPAVPAIEDFRWGTI